ncbi:hypothetical protein SAMN05216356_1335 [Oribacterium sp. WCC10]|nr:hypothetical protein SAMN05216356_1335 [Oribacterium sp. WCC10]
MNPKKADWNIFVISFAVVGVTAFIYYSYYGVGNNRLLLAILHSFCSSLTMVYVLAKVEKSSQKKGFSLVAVLLIVMVLYNQNSVTKFSVRSLFEGYTDNNMIRLLGGVYVDVIIIITTFFWSRYRQNKLRKSFNVFTGEKKIIHISSYVMYGMVTVLFLISQLASSVYTISRSQKTFVEAIYYVTCATEVIYVKNRENKKSLRKYIPLLLVGVLRVVEAMTHGGKSAIVKYLLIIALGLWYMDVLKFKYIKLATCISPAVLQLVTIITEIVSNRMVYFNEEWVMRYHAFRYDLSDFSITIALKSDFSYGFRLIRDAIVFAIPGFDMQEKNNILYNGAYRKQMASIGLSAVDMTGNLEDFNDTLFSIGAEIFGIIGMFLFFAFTVAFFEWISKKLLKSKVGYMLLLVLIGPACLVECDLLTFVYTIRDSALICLMAYYSFKIIKILQHRGIYGR